MSEKARFTPIRGAEETLLAYPYKNGQLYFATDTGKMYLDCIDPAGQPKEKLSVGGGGVSVIYGNDPEPIALSEEEDNTKFSLMLNALEAKCHVDDLILNIDGCFYKVNSVDPLVANCTRLAVSGSGGGGGGISVIDLFLDVDYTTIDQNFTYIHGAQSYAVFTPRTETDDNTVTMTFTILNNENGVEDKHTVSNIRKNSKYSFDMSVLPLSNDISLTVTITAMNSFMPGQSRSWVFNGISTVSIGVKKANNNFVSAVIGNNNGGEKVLEYIPVGPTDEKNRNLVETLHVYIDGEEDLSYKKDLRRGNFNTTNTINIAKQTHGSHTISLAVSATVNNVSIMSDPIDFDVAWANIGNEDATLDDDAPIIWIGGYDETVINYENSYVRYMVLDPIAYKQGLPATIQLYKDGVMLNEFTLNYSTEGWAEWDISAIYSVGTNLFSIACRSAKKDFIINVTEEGSRELGLAKDSSLILNYTTAGRSNLELKSARSVWKDSKGSQATLTGFNWQSNGWMKDDVVTGDVDNGTYLSLTNGAAVSIPCRKIQLNESDDYSIEVRFRVRNVQEYSTLVQTFPTYFYIDENNLLHNSPGDGELLSEIEKNHWTVAKDEWGADAIDGNNTVKQVETTKGVICKWMDAEDKNGFCLGSQEAFFKTDRGVISVRYKEDEVINITFVVSKTDGLVYIYLNGILSGANSLPAGTSAAFTIENNFNFNSDYCDIDLYRIRVFQAGLAMPDVIHNYLSDLHSIALYDQNQLTDASRPTLLSYELLTQYNKENPTKPTMPYCVWKITSVANEKLPYFKGNSKKVDITFVNAPLDAALKAGEIDEWYYYTHSPSFYATGVDIDVQGTSSQGYPRRNYKTKYKNATSWVYTQGSLAGQSLTEKHTVQDAIGNEHTVGKKFHMDNEDVGTNKFTWKIDYMESSGTYNTGFANLMGNPVHPLYTKHPLEDLGLDGSGLRTSVYGYPVLTFHEYTNYANNPSSGNVNNEAFRYEYIGRYNMNLDKGSNEYYGFESEEPHPYVEGNPPIAEIAECWELSDNQGTWCSWKYPTADARAAGFGTLQDGYTDRLEVMRHFEYRYSHYADQLDGIGPDGKYDGVLNDSIPKELAIIEQIGRTNSEKSAYARNVYRNLERVFNWLDSTDTNTATNASITPVTWRTSQAYSGLGETSEPIWGYVAVSSSALFDENTTYYLSSGGDTYTEANIDPDVGFIENVRYYTRNVIYYNTTFANDTASYRIEKFRNEFTKHLDKEYCLVYFIMTELLLCYDSRGKNMMFASWGPHEEGGEYIWYPIFYDIDTQLGLNNSGAYLWDYDADVTKDGLFSTPTSVLWTNFYAVFEDDIKNKYRVLRGVNDGTNVSNSLTYENITGAYECNAQTFNSYAMAGVRPIIAIGLDEYYKYFATTTITGYFDTEGIKIIESSPQYAYCCQGDKKLTTELLLRNRLNYIDSWWLGGSYEINKVKQGQFWGRVNGNRIDKTSDTYIDLPAEEIQNRLDMANDPDSPLTDKQREKYLTYARVTAATYPKPYYDSTPGFTITPFLKEYVSYYTDEVPGLPVKYVGDESQKNGVKTSVPESTIATYKTEAETPNEQLVYIPGLDYLSSLGDLSTSYFSEFSLESGKRLLDLILGSDVPNYKNALIDANKKFELHNGSNDTGKKSLLQKMVMTGMTTFDKTLDMRGSGKLKEFRALRTKVPNVYFAKGAPLHTVHLPNTLTTLELIENTELTNIITNKNVVNNICTLNSSTGEAEYADPSTYRGLYLEDITDYATANANAGHALSSLVIEGGGLGFGSYTILENLVKLKYNAENNKTLRISLKDVNWTPYTQVEYGTPYNSSIQYYELTDHNTYQACASYTDNESKWDTDTLNGVIYTLDTYLYNLNPIRNLNVLDQLIERSTGDKERFHGITSTLPTITGNLFVYNTIAIKEDSSNVNDRTLNYYKQKFPNLNITVAKVTPSSISKYIQILDSGKNEVIDLLKTSDAHPSMTSEIPTKTNYDFIGWSTDVVVQGNDSTPTLVSGSTYTLKLSTIENGCKVNDVIYNIDGNFYRVNSISAPLVNCTKVTEESVMFVKYDNINRTYIGLEDALSSYTFSDTENNNTIVLYAVFTVHRQVVDFIFPDNSIKTTYVPYNRIIITPEEVPWKDDSNLEPEETNQFLGWSLSQTGETLIDLQTFKITKDYKATTNNAFYAIFSDTPISVYDNVHPDWFEIINANDNYYDNGETYSGLSIKLVKKAKGKLTIPAQINGVNVIRISSNNTGSLTADPLLNEITHVFFQKIDDVAPIKVISDFTFKAVTSLRYCEFPTGLLYIGSQAFQAVNNLSEVKIINGTVNTLGQGCFINAFNNGSASDKTGTLLVDGNVRIFRNSAFGNLNNGWFDTLQLGTPEHPMSAAGFGNGCFSISTNVQHFNNIVVYAANINTSPYNSKYTMLVELFGSGQNYTDDQINIY